MLARSLRGLLLAMCADHTTPSMQPWLASLRGIIKGTPPAPVDLMWSTFMGACVSQCVCTVFRCLELIPAQDDPLTFNLVSFGFLLYIHAYAQEFIPNAHVYFILAVRVFELLGMNTLLTVRHPPISRLAFTTVTGLLLSAHFLFVTIYTNEYPVLHSATRVIETLVVGIIALTIVLHALTMYLVDGSVRMDKLLRLRGTQPRPNDDFSLAVLKVGNACLQATQCSGLAREIGPLATPLHTYVEMYSSGRSQLEYGLDDMDVAELQGINGFDTEVRYTRDARGCRTRIGQCSSRRRQAACWTRFCHAPREHCIADAAYDIQSHLNVSSCTSNVFTKASALSPTVLARDQWRGTA